MIQYVSVIAVCAMAKLVRVGPEATILSPEVLMMDVSKRSIALANVSVVGVKKRRLSSKHYVSCQLRSK